MFDDIFRRFVAGEISGPVATMQLLLAERRPAQAAEAVAASDDARIRQLSTLLDGCEGLAEALAVQRAEAAEEMDEPDAIARNRAMFDRLVGQSPEASVALYSLGRPEVLARATDEIVRVLDDWDLLGPQRRVLDLGCGIGRIAAAIAPAVARVTGIDISSAMVAEARRRSAGRANVDFHIGSGRDLAGCGDSGRDLIVAVDSFPYLVEAGPEIVQAHFAETRRVLIPGGDFLILNYSYSGTVEDDMAEIAELAERYGFAVVRSGERPFALWDGIAFHLRRS